MSGDLGRNKAPRAAGPQAAEPQLSSPQRTPSEHPAQGGFWKSPSLLFALIDQPPPQACPNLLYFQ